MSSNGNSGGRADNECDGSHCHHCIKCLIGVRPETRDVQASLQEISP